MIRIWLGLFVSLALLLQGTAYGILPLGGAGVAVQQTATPTFSPIAGTYSAAQTVTLSSSTPGSFVYYTTDNSTPTYPITGTTQLYSSPLSVSSNQTINALGATAGYANSAVGSATYSIQAAVPTFSPAAGTYGSAQSVTLSSSTAGASIYYTTDNSVPTYPITGTTQLYSSPITVSVSGFVKALSVAAGYANSAVASAAYTISTTTTQLFPRFGVQAFIYTQLPTSSTINGLARYPWILLGGNYSGSVGGSLLTRDQIVTGLKGQSLTGANAVKPIVGQYENMVNLASNTPEWTTVVDANNWILYNSGSSGSQPSSTTYVIPGHVTGINKDSATGYWPWQWVGQYVHDRYITGGGLATSTSGANMASTSLDFIYLDNTAGYLPSNGDWDRTGSSQGYTDATATTNASTGRLDAPTQWASIDSTRAFSANTAYAYSSGTSGGLGLTGAAAAMSGKYSYGMQQFLFGRGASVVMGWGGFSTALQWYQAMSTADKVGTPTLTGAFDSGDYQSMRQALCFTAVFGNGYFVPGMSYAALGNSGGDGVDGANTSTWPYLDEFWGGTGSSHPLGGYLGAPLGTSQGNVQTTTTYSHVYRRDFANGIVLINDGSGGSQTVTLEKNYYHLATAYGSQSPPNSGGAATNTVTIPTFTYPGTSTTVGDCVVMLDAAP